MGAGSYGAMRTSLLTPRSAPTAIAAVLALSSIPALGQEAAVAPLDGPIVTSPAATSVTVPAEPAPVLVVPDVSSVEAAEPAAQTTARATPAQPQARSALATTRAAPVAASAAAPAADPVVAESEPPAAAVETEAELPPAMPAGEPTNIQPTPEQATDITAVLGLILVTLLGLVLAIFAFAYLRRRRAALIGSEAAPARRVEAPRETAPRPVASVAEPAPLAEPVPVLDRAPTRVLRSNAAAVPLPAQLPESYEERDALLKRMMDAPPDRANPFTDRRARMRRARLILQSLGRKFENAKPWIDFSDYPENWPALARQPQPAAAPMRTRELEPA